MPQGPQNPVRHQFPKRRVNADFGDEMESNGGETPRDAGSPPNHNAATPPPSQVAARNQNPPAAVSHAQPAGPITTEGPRSRIPQHRKRSKFSRRNIAIANGKSKNKLFAVVHPLHLAVIFFSVVAIAMMGAALGTDYWYIATSGSTYARVGLFKQCDGSGNCNDIQFNTVSYGSLCTRSGDDLKQVNNVVIGLAIAGCVLSLIASLLAGVSRCVAQAVTSWLALVVTLLCAGCYAAAVGYYVYNKENWEFCSSGFCSMMGKLAPSQACDASYGYSLGLAAVAIGAGFLAFLFATFRIVFREWNIVDEEAAPAISTDELAPQNRPRVQHAPVTTEPYPPADLSDREAEVDEKIPPPPEGDWVYDSECGMYWSESEFLFLDPYTQHSYDPNSDMWYDPDADEWYQGEQIES